MPLGEYNRSRKKYSFPSSLCLRMKTSQSAKPARSIFGQKRINLKRILEVLTGSHTKMAAVNGRLWSKISLCPRASSALYGHQNITFTKIVYRQYVSRVVQSATFMMKQEGELVLKLKTRED